MASKFILDNNKNYIKIHGLQRTATNYVSYLIDENIENTKCLVNIGGWKHGHYCVPWTLDREIDVVVVTKNPYAWCLSLYNYTKPQMSFDQFIKRPIIFGEPKGSPFLLKAANPIQHWNSMNFHWLSIVMNEKKVCFVSFESFLNNAEDMVFRIANYFGFDCKKVFKNTNKITNPSEENINLSNQDFDKNFYINKSYLKSFSPESLNFVKQQIDADVLHQLGYSIL